MCTNRPRALQEMESAIFFFLFLFFFGEDAGPFLRFFFFFNLDFHCWPGHGRNIHIC